MKNYNFSKLYALIFLSILLASLPNLSQAIGNLTPYKMSGWSDKIVVSNTSGGTTDSNPLYTSDILSISWALINDGDAKIVGPFFIDLYVDGVKIKSSSIDSLDSGWYFWWKGYTEIVLRESGEHTVRLVVDSTNTISENNENDNFYDKKINILTRNPTSRLIWNSNGHYYQRIENPVNWQEAKSYCESQGGYLATITSKEENDFIFSQLGGSSYALWIGGTDAGHEGIWSWVNNEPWNYSNWDTGEPNNAEGNENSLQMVGTGKWNDNNSDVKIWFSCEWDSTSTPLSSSHAINLSISQSGPGRYRLLGTLVDANGQPACGLALASGRCVFTCGPGSPRCEGGTDSLAFGQFDLTDLPTETNGTLNLQTFVAGSAPGFQVVKPDGSVQLVSGATSGANSHTLNTTINEVSPGRYRLLGTLLDANNQPACGLVLASGRCMFSCGSGSPRCEGGISNLAFGQFDLTDLPTEANGTLNLQTFVAGSMPGFEVVQPPANGCSYAIDPTSKTFGYQRDMGTVNVITQSGCAWTAQSNNSWIAITRGASGAGPGEVGYEVSVNSSGAIRTGTVTIAGKILTISQNASGGEN